MKKNAASGAPSISQGLRRPKRVCVRSERLPTHGWKNMLMMLSQVRMKPINAGGQAQILQHGRDQAVEQRPDDADAEEAEAKNEGFAPGERLTNHVRCSFADDGLRWPDDRV